MKLTFIIHYARGPAWVEGKSVFEQPLQEHLAYMNGLKAQKKLLLGGPFTDDTGGLIVVDAASAQEARSMADADPAVAAGVMVAAAHPWLLMAGALA